MNNLLKSGFILSGVFALGMLQYTSEAQVRQATRRNNAAVQQNQNQEQDESAAIVDTSVTPMLVDSLPLRNVKPSLRPNSAVDEGTPITDRTPLPYEHLRADDAVYRQKIWRDIDAREKLNLPFRYAADDDNGNQRFISILFQAIQNGQDNGGVTAFSSVDDRFTTPMTVNEVAQLVAGEPVVVPQYDSLGNELPPIVRMPEVNLDSFYKFRIKEEVIFDKESSRLFWRILGIAPLKNVITSSGVDLGETELFWVYYPDLRPTLAKYETYNGKNFGAKMSWEELFESRMFDGRIVKSTLDNPYDIFLKEQPGLKDRNILQLLEGERIKEEIFNYEQSQWSY